MEQEVKARYEQYYLVASKQTPKGKVVAEYDTRNGNLHLLIYNREGIIRNAYFDDDNDGRVETFFSNGERERRKRRTWREFLRHPFTKTDNEKQFKIVDRQFQALKQSLDLDDLIDGNPLVK